MESPFDILVIDTSSLIEVRDLVGGRDHAKVLKSLGKLAANGALLYPREVVNELSRTNDPDDPVVLWSKDNAPNSCRVATDYPTLRRILEMVPTVLDPHKTGVEEADPYVLCTAVQMHEEGSIVRIITEDRRDKLTGDRRSTGKMSLATAAGILGIPSLPLAAFLHSQGIWPAA